MLILCIIYFTVVPQLKIALSSVISDIKDFDRQQQFLDITNRILETMRELYAIFTPEAVGMSDRYKLIVI